MRPPSMPSGKFYRDNRFPAYIYDKLAGGLIDAKRYAADDSAVAVLHKDDAGRDSVPAAPRDAAQRACAARRGLQ